MLSKTSRNGIEAVLYLALRTDSESLIGVKELAKNTTVSKAMLSKILHQLTKKRLIESRRGRHGGFYMTEKQKSIQVLEVIKTLEQIDELIDCCLLGQQHCMNGNYCPYHEHVNTIKSQFDAIYKVDTIVETARKIDQMTSENR